MIKILICLLKFCSTRKVTSTTATFLAKTNKYIINHEHKKCLISSASKLKDARLKELVSQNGIGYHHAGMDTSDRTLIEQLFLNGNLFVLLCTSTLAIGINLPAHLVIIKSTKFYQHNSSYIDYTNTQILQMMTVYSIVLTSQ